MNIKRSLRKFIAFGIGLTIITSLVLTGCGGGGSSSQTSNVSPDITPPTTTVAPAASSTTDTTTNISVTINENGTGYYLVQLAAAAAPTIAAVQAGTSFAMTANVAASNAISGLTASTAYTIYFIAKDVANNVQTTLQSVAVVTAATPLPAGYVAQGGLIWMPATFSDTWTNANSYCSLGTINGQTGWRLPTQGELLALYASGAMNGQGWTLSDTWSSTPAPFSSYYGVNLVDGSSWSGNAYVFYVTCVR